MVRNDCKPVDYCSESIEKLQKLHPDVFEELPVDDSFFPFVFDPYSTLDTYPKGSAGGVSFWTMDLFPNELSSDLVSIFTCLFNLISSGKVSRTLSLFHTSSRLTSSRLPKSNKMIRPITMGDLLYKIVS
ncbi:hypothetical protein GEMRC1_007498 [Eukaryota sp. GEM-RC1]